MSDSMRYRKQPPFQFWALGKMFLVEFFQVLLSSKHACLFLAGRQLLRQGYWGGLLAERERKKQTARPVSPSRRLSVASSALAEAPVAAHTKARATWGPDPHIILGTSLICSEAFHVARVSL